MSQAFVIEEVATMSGEVFQGILALLPQLSTSAETPSYEHIEEIVKSQATQIFFARDGLINLNIVGSLTLVVFRIPTGVRAWIEDVVVNESHRGMGIGAELCRAAIISATNAGARTVDLTSRASRQAANRLYLSVGFKLRETNVYRYIPQGL
jgi:ribosomal protein S18 acetylase RimI-like enzyme